VKQGFPDLIEPGKILTNGGAPERLIDYFYNIPNIEKER